MRPEETKGLAVDRQGLQPYLEHMHTAFGLRLVVFDAEGRVLAAHPEKAGLFCRFVQRSYKGRMRCREDEANALREVSRLRAPYHIYTCHAGFAVAVAPLQEEGHLLGYIRYSECTSAKQPLASSWEDTCTRCKDVIPQDELSDLRGEFYALPRLSPAQLTAYAELIRASSAHIIQNNYVRPDSTHIFATINRYINQNLSAELSAEVLCEQLLLPRNQVYAVVREETGRTLGQYIRQKRLELAEALLLRSELSVTEIAAKVGIQDPGYFSRLFRKSYGLPPREYRRLNLPR